MSQLEQGWQYREISGPAPLLMSRPLPNGSAHLFELQCFNRGMQVLAWRTGLQSCWGTEVLHLCLHGFQCVSHWLRYKEFEILFLGRKII